VVVQRKILSADKLLARNWPCKPTCPMCDQESETAEHFCLRCVVFAQEVWLLVAEWTEDEVPVPGCYATLLIHWWNSGLALPSNVDKNKRATITRLGTFGMRETQEFFMVSPLHRAECCSSSRTKWLPGLPPARSKCHQSFHNVSPVFEF
jgi:hypothetical protein